MNKKIADLLLFKQLWIAGKMVSPRIGLFPFFPDSRILFSHIDKLDIIAEELAKAISPINPDLIAAQEAAGVPFGVAVSLKLKKNFLYLRKEPKNYLTNNLIEGDFLPGQKVVIVDDFVSKGEGKKKCVDVLEKAGLNVVGVVVYNDTHYGEKYLEEQAWLRKSQKYNFISLLNWPDFMDYAGEVGFFSIEFCELIKNWLNDPIVWQTKPENWKNFKKLALKEKNITFHSSFIDI
jgi:orotate phosphoribosyltransferase